MTTINELPPEFQKSKINETELCSKIQKLMFNIKSFCKDDHSSESPQTEEFSVTESMFTVVESQVDNKSEDVSISSMSSAGKEEPDTQCSVLHDRENTDFNYGTGERKASLTVGCTPVDSNLNNTSETLMIPQRTFLKVVALETLIDSIEKSLNATSFSEYTQIGLKKKFQDLKIEYQDVKNEVKIGTEKQLPENEVFKIMKRLKELFENLFSLQKDLRESKECNMADEDSFRSSSLGKANRKIRPSVPPRMKNINVLSQATEVSQSSLKSEKELTKVTDSASTTKRQIGSNLSNVSTYLAYGKCVSQFDTKTIDYKQRNFSHMCNDQLDNLKLALFRQSSSDPYNNMSLQMNKFHLNSFIRPNKRLSIFPKSDLSKSDVSLITKSASTSENLNKNFVNFCEKTIGKSRLTQSTNNLFRPNTPFARPSKLPVLKKDLHHTIVPDNKSKISSISQAVTCQVLGNLKRMGFVAESKNLTSEDVKKPKVKTAIHQRSKSDLSLDRNPGKVAYNTDKEDQIAKTTFSSLFLTKIGSYHSLKNAKTLLKKKKYQFLNDSSLNNHNNSDVNNDNTTICEEDLDTLMNSNLVTRSGENSFSRPENELRVSLLRANGNSIRIIHQLVSMSAQLVLDDNEPFCRSRREPPCSHLKQSKSSKHLNSSEPQHRRLAHIERVCSCRITVQQPQKMSLQLQRILEIHYDLRRGKAVGCINLLRHLEDGDSSSDSPISMKILRSTLLLPGGFLTELRGCSIAELVNLSTSCHARDLVRRAAGWTRNTERQKHTETRRLLKKQTPVS